MQVQCNASLSALVIHIGSLSLQFFAVQFHFEISNWVNDLREIHFLVSPMHCSLYHIYPLYLWSRQWYAQRQEAFYKAFNTATETMIFFVKCFLALSSPFGDITCFALTLAYTGSFWLLDLDGVSTVYIFSSTCKLRMFSSALHLTKFSAGRNFAWWRTLTLWTILS